MPDFVGTAGANTDNAKASALDAIAQTGSQAKTAFDQAQATNAANKTQALKAAMAYSALRGAPAGNVQAGQDQIAAPLNDRATALDTIKQNYAMNNDATGKAFGQFFDLTKAGLPIAQTRLDQTAKSLQEKAAQASQDRAMRMEVLRQNAEDRHQAMLDREADRQAKLQQAMTPGKWIAAMGGRDAVGDALNGAVDKRYNNQPGFGAPESGSSTGGDLALPPEMEPATRDSMIPGVVGETPLNLDSALGFMRDALSKDSRDQLSLDRSTASASRITPDQVRNTPKYPDALRQAVTDIGKSQSPGDVMGHLSSVYGIPNEAAWVIYQDALKGMTATRSANGGL